MKDKEKNTNEQAEVKDEKVKESEKKPEEQKKEKTNKKEKNEVEKLQTELAEEKDKFLRLYAEYDNFRKRSQKEKSDIYTSSKADVIKELLPILDNFDRAAANSEADFDGYKKGIELIFNQFLQLLEKYGVESFGAEGDKFDPNLHSAVMAVEDENLGENEIAQVFSKGYKLGDKIIREAVVKVANS
jgi:molecular chaperone GrpE